jgi:hypothetical protein
LFVALFLPSTGTDDRQVIGAALPTSGLPVPAFSSHATDTEAFVRFPEHAPHDQSHPAFAFAFAFAVAFALDVAVTLVVLPFRLVRRVPSFSARFPEQAHQVLIFSGFFRTHATDTEAFVRFPEHTPNVHTFPFLSLQLQRNRLQLQKTSHYVLAFAVRRFVVVFGGFFMGFRRFFLQLGWWAGIIE